MITCPECGKAVSDKATSCPSCGFNVRAWCDEKAQAEAQRKAQERLQSQMQWRQQAQARLDEAELGRIMTNVKVPKRRPVTSASIVSGIILLIICSLFLLFWILNADAKIGFPMFLLISFLGLPAIMLLNSGVRSLKAKQNLYDNYKNNPIGYKKAAATEILDYKRNMERQRAWETQRNIRPQINIKCPNCGSANTAKISTLSRAVSTGMVGLASSEIGKTYECKTCGYKW